MARPPIGQVLERRGKRGRTFALRFYAYGKRRYVTTTATSCEEAETELANVLADVRRGIWRPPEPAREVEMPAHQPTFHEYASRWLDDRSPELRPRSVDALEWALSCHLLPFFKDHRLGDITVAEVHRYRSAKVRERLNMTHAVTASMWTPSSVARCRASAS